MHTLISELYSLLKQSLLDTFKVAIKVYKVVIPIVILIKILTEYNLTHYLSYPLEPIMSLVGLPAEYGLAWAAALLVSLYSGIVVLVGLIPVIGIPTVAEASTFSLMALIAHSMLLECKITQECGVSFWGQFFIRFIVAIFAGMAMFAFYSFTGFHSYPATILLEVPETSTLSAWAIGEISNLCRIFLIIWFVLLLHAFLKRVHITDILEKLLSPFLALLGMSPATASTIVVGFFAGILYGSGLLIKTSHEHKMSKKDLFCAISLMGLAHALIEDTILMLLIGGSPWVTLGARFIIVLIVGLLISHLYDLLITKKQRAKI